MYQDKRLSHIVSLYQYLCTCGNSVRIMLASGKMLYMMYSYYFFFSSKFGYIFLRSSSLFNAGGRLGLTHKFSIYTAEDSRGIEIGLKFKIQSLKRFYIKIKADYYCFKILFLIVCYYYFSMLESFML